MGDVILRANTVVRLQQMDGTVAAFHPGDWFAVKNRNKARELVETGRATMPGAAEARKAVVGDLSDCGIVVRNGELKAAAHVQAAHEEIDAVVGDCELPFGRTLLWDPMMPMTVARAVLGFCRIDGSGYARWEVAAMLRGDVLARTFGSDEDKAGTLQLFGDLRLPVYETQAVWVRKTTQSKKFVARWREEVEGGCGEEHAFLRALFTYKVILNTLPQGWLARWVEDL